MSGEAAHGMINKMPFGEAEWQVAANSAGGDPVLLLESLQSSDFVEVHGMSGGTFFRDATQAVLGGE